MSDAEVLNVVLWTVQGFLALFFVAAGAPKIFGRGIDRWTGFSELPRSQVVVTGFAEVLGAVGLVLPMAFGISEWLMPLAAIGLAVIVLMATGFHVRGADLSTRLRRHCGPPSRLAWRSDGGTSSRPTSTRRHGC